MRFGRDGILMLPESRLWELVPTFRTTQPRPGARWIDTVAWAAQHEEFRQTLRGVRVSMILRDTLVEGRRLWVVRDSARVRYEERQLVEERTLDTVVVLTRKVDGVIRGQHLYDPELGLFRARSDTTRLLGEAVLRYPQNYAGPRELRTPVRYERYRQWGVRDEAGYRARQAELFASTDRAMGGMVLVPNGALERRLAEGDTVARDSLIGELHRATDQGEYERLFNILGSWDRRRGVLRLDSIRIADGDSVYLHEMILYEYPPRVDTMTVRRILPFMSDPGLAFSLNVSRESLYEKLQEALLAFAPAATRDTVQWACTPAACRMLADQWRAGREPRLREVGLIALFVLDPARWADSVVARAEAGSRLLQQPAMLARGVGATWPAASKKVIPEPNADWRTWVEWMNGIDPRYAAARAADRASSPPRVTQPPVRFMSSHATAIRFFQARTGRDVIGELRRAYQQATADSARFMFATLLHGLGELTLSPDEIAAEYRSRRPIRMALADQSLHELFEKPTEPADSATVFQLLDRLVALVVEGTPVWRRFSGRPSDSERHGPELHQAPSQRAIYLLGDSMPTVLLEKWKGRITILTLREWKSQPLTEAGVLYEFTDVRRVGPFVRLGIDTMERTARRAGDAPRVYAAYVTYYLMEFNGEWVIVSWDSWVT